MKRQFFTASLAVLVIVGYLGSPSLAQTKSSIAQDARRMDQVVRFFSDGQKTFMGSALVARGSDVLFASAKMTATANGTQIIESIDWEFWGTGYSIPK